MAKKKAIEGTETLTGQTNAPEPENPQINTETAESSVDKEADEVDNEPEKEPTNSGHKGAADSSEKDEIITETTGESQDDIPPFALNYLKRHVEIKEAYIDKLGGVFPTDTPKAFLNDAVLYQNPFYK